MPNLETEFTELIEKANALGISAEAHDKACSNVCHEPDHEHDPECFENRAFIVALVIDRLGMSIFDLGYIADKLMELQSEGGCRPCGDETPDDAPVVDEWPKIIGEEQ